MEEAYDGASSWTVRVPPCVGLILDLILQFVSVQLQLLLCYCRSPPPSNVTWYHNSGSGMYRLDSCEVYSSYPRKVTQLKKIHLSG